jgi:hypothetical protein
LTYPLKRLVLIDLARAKDALVAPHWNSNRVCWLLPFELLDCVWHGLLDQVANVSQRLTAPVTQLVDDPIDGL